MKGSQILTGHVVCHPPTQPFFNNIWEGGKPVQAMQAVGWSRADWRLAWLEQLPPPPPPPPPTAPPPPSPPPV